jgi:hypothetical protein
VGLIGYLAVGAIGRGTELSPLLGSTSQLSLLFLFAWSLGWLLIFGGRSTVGQRLVVFGLMVPAVMTIALVTFSNKSLIMTLAGLPIVAYWYARRRVAWLTLVTLLLVSVFLIFPLYTTYRVTAPDMDQRQRMETAYRTIRGWTLEEYLQGSVTGFQRRMALINSVAAIVRDVPRWVPFAQGETLFLPTMAALTPRVIWHGKPTVSLGRSFGDLFRITHPFDRNTSIAPTLPGELYWNFALPGILAGMLLVGIAMRALYRRYGEEAEGGSIVLAMNMVILVQWAFVGGVIASEIATMLRTVLLLEAVRWISRRNGLIGVRGPKTVP